MVLRIARRGSNAGNRFGAAPAFPTAKAPASFEQYGFSLLPDKLKLELHENSLFTHMEFWLNPPAFIPAVAGRAKAGGVV